MFDGFVYARDFFYLREYQMVNQIFIMDIRIQWISFLMKWKDQNLVLKSCIFYT